MNAREGGNQLIFHGTLVFLLGLLTGFFVDFGLFANNRQGLSAHLEGLMNGTFLIALGLAWTRVRLSAGKERLARRLPVFGAYSNWLLALWAATTGRGRASSIRGADRASFTGEMLIMNAWLLLLALAFVVCCLLVLWGLRAPDVQAARASEASTE